MTVRLVGGVTSLELTDSKWTAFYSNFDLVDNVNLHRLSFRTSITKKWEGKITCDGSCFFNLQGFDASPTNECKLRLTD